MKRKIINAKIWLPNDYESIRVQELKFKNMDKAINNVSKQLGAMVRITTYIPLGSENRYTQLSNDTVKQPTLMMYEEYLNEHPVIKVLINSFYNGRISYYKLCEYLASAQGLNITDLMAYYNAFTYGASEIVRISDAQESVLDIKETAHGYDPAETELLREYRHELARRGQWVPSHGSILEEASVNEFVLKRVFKR